MINEGNKQDEYLEKKGESSKTTAMRKASSRRGRFSSGDTHKDSERENITWARPGTRPYDDSLDRQRKQAHRSERRKKKPKAGTSPEDRKWSEFSGDEPEGKYEKLQKAKKSGQRTNIEAQKQGLVRKGERRRQLRTQAVDAIRRAMGGGYVSEAKVDDRLSADQKQIIRNRRLSPGDRLPVRGESPRDTEERLTKKRRDRNKRNRGGRGVRGSQLPKYKKHAEFGGVTYQKDWNPEKVSARRDELRAKSAKNNIRNFREQKTFSEFMTESYRHFVRQVDEDFVPLTPDKEKRVKQRVGELARDIQLQVARMKELKKKPLGRFRPKVKKEKKAIVKSARKKAKQVRSASDALIDASTSRSAKIQKRIQDLKGES